VIRALQVLWFVVAVVAAQPVAAGIEPSPFRISDFQAVMQNTPDPSTGGGTISLLVNSALFGPGGFAGGQVLDLGTASGVPPDDGLWLTDPFSGMTPDDNIVAIGFGYDRAGQVSGVEPTPFRVFMGIGPFMGVDPSPFLGELDFSEVTGSLGSLNLAGVLVHEVDATGARTGTTYDLDPFTIQAVPLPASVWLFLGGLAAFAGLRRRRISRKYGNIVPVFRG